MCHGIVWLVVLATFSLVKYHGCNRQQITASPLPLALPPPPPTPPQPGPDLNCCNEQFAPPQPFVLPPPSPFLRGSDPYSYNYYHDDSKSGINVAMLVVVAAIAVVLLVAVVLIERKFRTISSGVKGLYKMLETIVKSLGGISTGISGISTGVGNINAGIGKINTNIEKISKRLDDITTEPKVSVILVQCRSCGCSYRYGSICSCGSTWSTCPCSGSLCSCSSSCGTCRC